MKAVVFRGIGDIRIENVPDPRIQQPTDAVIRITAAAICGTDLHFVRGTLGDMKPGTILGHEAVGVVEELGPAVRNLRIGDRVVVASTIACGSCSYCRAGYFSQCDKSNPRGNRAGTCFFGGPESSGSINGLQAERARIPFANVGLVRIPDGVTDEQAILVSDIFPTAMFATDLAEIHPGNTVAVFGCGPVGLLAVACAYLRDAGRVFAIDTIPSRLDAARKLGAEVVDFNRDDPVETIVELTGGIGTDRAIDAVGLDAVRPEHGPAARKSRRFKKEFDEEAAQVAPDAKPDGDNWRPGNAPSQALCWAVDVLAKAGTLGIVGVYSENVSGFPIGDAAEKNLAVNMGNCHHRRYIPRLLRMIRSGSLDPASFVTQHEPLTDALHAYREFDRREPGWIKVELEPSALPIQEASLDHADRTARRGPRRPRTTGRGRSRSRPRG